MFRRDVEDRRLIVIEDVARLPIDAAAEVPGHLAVVQELRLYLVGRR